MPPGINSIPSSRSASPSSTPLQQRDVPLPSEPSVQPQLQFQPQTQPQNSSQFSRSPTYSGRPSVSERRRSVHNLTGELPTSTSERRPSISHVFRTASPSSTGGSPTVTTGDPHHHRTPSLGELHQELEQEQEAQVNRLLQTIRSQQLQLQQLQQQQQQQQPSSDTPVVEETTTSSQPSASVPSASPFPTVVSRPSPQISSSLSNRRHSRSSSRTTSPSLRPLRGTSIDSSRGVGGSEWTTGACESSARRSNLDESAFYHAEASTLMRENQMLKQRIRDLERQISETITTSTQPSLTGTGGLSMPPSGADAGAAGHPASTNSESMAAQEKT